MYLVRTWLFRRKWLSFVAGFLVVCVVFVVYYPSIKVGFLGDDWWFLGKAASLSLPDYLTFYFEPAAQIFWYRPLYGLVLLIEFLFFRASPEGYHVVQIALHALNSLLLFAVIHQISRRTRLALLAALLFAVLPINNLAIFWIAVQDPLAMVFYLGAVWSWVLFLQRGRARYYALAFVCYLLALLGKESSVFLPVTLFLIDRLLLWRGTPLSDLFRRYALFGISAIAYFAIEYRVQTQAYFPKNWGYALGPHVLENLAHYVSLTVFPWGEDIPVVSYAVMVIVLAVLSVWGLRKRSGLLALVAIQVLLAIAPALPFATPFFQARYLYLAAALSAILLAILLELVLKRFGAHSMVIALVSAGTVALILLGSWMTSVNGEKRAEEARQMRVPIRDIFQQHPTYPPGTFLLFVEPPYPMIMRNLTGMFYLRYGPNVTVLTTDPEWGGVDQNRVASFCEYPNSYVYYFDESGTRGEVKVDPSTRTNVAPELPARLGGGIRLEDVKTSSTTLRRGEDWVLLLYWRALRGVDKDYTVFIHLVSDRGEIVLGEDTQPRGNRAPTRTWRLDKLITDAHILSIPQDVPPGNYHLEIGLYYLPTQERLQVMNDRDQPVKDHIEIQSFTVLP